MPLQYFLNHVLNVVALVLVCLATVLINARARTSAPTVPALPCSQTRQICRDAKWCSQAVHTSNYPDNIFTKNPKPVEMVRFGMTLRAVVTCI